MEQQMGPGRSSVFGSPRALSLHASGTTMGSTELSFSGDADNMLMESDPLDDGSTTYITLPLHFLQDGSILETGTSSHNFVLKSIAGNTVLLDSTSQFTFLSGNSSQVVLSAEGLLQDGDGSVFESEILSAKNKGLEKADVPPGLGIDIAAIHLNNLGTGDVLSVPSAVLPTSQKPGNTGLTFNLTSSIPPTLLPPAATIPTLAIQAPIAPTLLPVQIPSSEEPKPDLPKQQKRGPGRPRRDEAEVGPPIGKGPFSCDTCSKQFIKWAQLKRHIKCHSDDKPYLCSECSASFNVESNLILHKATHNVDDPRCPECDKKFSRIASLKAHVMLHEKEESLFCSECGDEFSTQAQLDSHKKEHLEEWKRTDKLYQCRQCHRDFTRASSLRDHMREHYKVKASLSHKCHKRNIDRTTFIHKCDTCFKCFQKPSQLIRHKRIHTGERPYKCELCSRAFNQKGSLQIHMSKHNGFKPFRCDFCAAMFSQKGNRRAHILRVHTIPRSGEQVYKCMECPCVFKKLGSLNAHMSRMHYTAEKRPNMDASQMVSVNVNAVMTELAELQGATEEKSKPMDSQTDADILQQALLNSGLSGKEQTQSAEPQKQNGSVPMKEELNEAFSATKSRNSQNKDTCSTNYITLADKALDGSVRRYIIRQRRIGSIRWHQCSYCSKEFKKPSDLVRHIRIHTHERPYKCNHCFRSFAVKSTLTAHIRTHTGVKDYTCYVCLKKFSSSSSLKVHIRMHTGNKPFQCQHCDKTFRTTGHRKAHMMCHIKDVPAGTEVRRRKSRVSNVELAELPDITLQEPILITENGLVQPAPQTNQVYLSGDMVSVERPYKCHDCSAGFRKSSHLKQHVRMHTGERPFKCGQCGKCFISNGVLKSHLRTHEGVKIFKCLLCNNMFSTNGSLKRHMNTHSDSRPFMCPYCHKTFKTSMNCRKHMKIHRHELAVQAVQQARSAKAANNLCNGLDINNSQFPPDGLGPDFTQAFSDQPFNVVDVEQQDQTESDFAQNTLVQTLTTGNLVESSTLPAGASVITHTLHADASGTITLPSLEGQHTLTQENIREIERTLNEQIFGTSASDRLVDENDQTATLAISGGGNDVRDDNSDMDSTTTEDLARTLGATSPAVQPQPLIPDKSNENKTDSNDIFVSSFEPPSFESCVFSPITLQSDPLALEGLSHRATISTNLASILPPPPSDPLLTSMEVNLDPVGGSRNTGIKEESVREGDPLVQDDEDIGQEKEVLETDETFLDEESLDPNDGPRPYSCKLCNKGFKKLCHLKDHLRTHTGEKQFSCSTCDQKYASVSALKAHLRTHSGEKDFACQVCDCRFTTNGSLSRHMIVHSNKRPFKCSMCEAQFRTANQLRRHIKLHEPREKKGRVIARDPMQARGRRRAAVIRLTAEQTEVLAQQPLENATSVSEKVLISSVAEKDRISEIKDPRQQYSLEPLHANQCKYCPKSFRKPSDLVRHIRIHTGERPYQCSCCNKCFTVKSTLDSHMKTHSGEKLCACHVCGCLFATKGSLKVHMRLHTGAKPFKCPFCDLRFRTSGHRKAHLISHTKEANNAKGENGSGQKVSQKRRKSGAALLSSDIAVSAPQEEIPEQPVAEITLDPASLNGLIPLPSTSEAFNPASLLTGTDGSNLQLQLTDGLQITGVDASGALLTTQSLQLDESLLQQLQASNIIIQSSVTGEGVEEPAETVENADISAPLDSGENSGMPAIIRFEIHTDENGQILNIQPTMEDGSTANNIIFNVGENLDMDVAEPAQLSLPEQPVSTRFRVTEAPKGTRPFTAIDDENGEVRDNIQDSLETEDDFLVFHDCETCGKRFSKPSQLERHNRIHTGERPFECHLCSKRFNQKNALNTHLKSHTGERPFRCPHCTFTFTQKGNMKTHMRRVHRFSSLEFGKQTSTKSVLKAKQPALGMCTEAVGKSLEQVVSDLFPQMQNTSIADNESSNKLC